MNGLIWGYIMSFVIVAFGAVLILGENEKMYSIGIIVFSMGIFATIMSSLTDYIVMSLEKRD